MLHSREFAESGATRIIPSFSARSFHSLICDIPSRPEPCNSNSNGAGRGELFRDKRIVSALATLRGDGLLLWLCGGKRSG